MNRFVRIGTVGMSLCLSIYPESHMPGDVNDQVELFLETPWGIVGIALYPGLSCRPFQVWGMTY